MEDNLQSALEDTLYPCNIDFLDILGAEYTMEATFMME
jgi:hypothetical protein